MNRKYQRDRIVEAICDIRFSHDGDWSPGWYTSFQDSLKEQYPQAAQTDQVTYKMAFGANEVKHSTERAGSTLELSTADGRDRVRFSPGILSIHRLDPYSHWEEFSPRIYAAVSAARACAQGFSLTRLGLRYINRFELKSPANLVDYFQIYPFLETAETEVVGPFHMRVELHDRELSGRILIVQVGLLPVTSPDSLTLLLDLDRLCLLPTSGSQAMEEHLTEAHARIVAGFEAFITERLRDELLGGRVVDNLSTG